SKFPLKFYSEITILVDQYIYAQLSYYDNEAHKQEGKFIGSGFISIREGLNSYIVSQEVNLRADIQSDNITLNGKKVDDLEQLVAILFPQSNDGHVLKIIDEVKRHLEWNVSLHPLFVL